mmetsp:Transcript_22817/g.58071  ORF Transcript_22817/g.58071 Transcript_22817/m.58071 type:complete len:279 (-) Transcript_22817:408-1244(-)
MPRKEEQYSSGSEEYDAGSDDEDYDLFGSMKTSVCWDAHDKQLSVNVRQYAESTHKVELKYKGHLNTSTGGYHFLGVLRKHFLTNTPSIQSVFQAARLQAAAARPGGLNAEQAAELRELDIDADRLLPAGLRPLVLRDWSVAPGVTYDSAGPAPGAAGPHSHLKYALFVRKAPQVLLHSPRTDLLLSAKASTELCPKSKQVTTRAHLRLKLFKYAVTSKQDLRVCVGLDMETVPLTTGSTAAAAGPRKSWAQSPYIKISENNTSVKLQQGRWSFMYEL